FAGILLNHGWPGVGVDHHVVEYHALGVGAGESLGRLNSHITKHNILDRHLAQPCNRALIGLCPAGGDVGEQEIAISRRAFAHWHDVIRLVAAHVKCRDHKRLGHVLHDDVRHGQAFDHAAAAALALHANADVGAVEDAVGNGYVAHAAGHFA